MAGMQKSAVSRTTSLPVRSRGQIVYGYNDRLDMFDAGIPFKIPNVSPARTRNFVSAGGSGSGSGLSVHATAVKASSNSLAVSNNLPLRRVSAAGDFYIPGENIPVGTVNPEIYQSDELDDWNGVHASSGHIGRVYFNLEFCPDKHELIVTVVKTFSKYNRNPPSHYDTFVRVYLLPDDTLFHKTKTQKKTILPQFDESFHFKVSESELKQRQLKLVMCEVDRKRKRYMTSFTLFPFKDFDTTVLKRTWQPLKPSILMDKFGADLQFSLCYEKNFHKLNVTIMDARNVFLPSKRLAFSHDESSHHLTCYVRVSLRRGSKTQKTKCTRTVPVTESSLLVKFNQQIQFSIRKESNDLLTSSLFIELMVRTEKMKEELVGELVVGPGSYATGSRVEQWMTMVDEPNHQIRMWHKLDYFTPR